VILATTGSSKNSIHERFFGCVAMPCQEIGYVQLLPENRSAMGVIDSEYSPVFQSWFAFFVLVELINSRFVVINKIAERSVLC